MESELESTRDHLQEVLTTLEVRMYMFTTHSHAHTHTERVAMFPHTERVAMFHLHTMCIYSQTKSAECVDVSRRLEVVQGELERETEIRRELEGQLESVSSQLREKEDQLQLLSNTAHKVSAGVVCIHRHHTLPHTGPVCAGREGERAGEGDSGGNVFSPGEGAGVGEGGRENEGDC